MTHKFKLGDKVKYFKDRGVLNLDDEDDDTPSYNYPSKYDGQVGTIIALCAKPEYSCDYAIALEAVPSSQYRNKKHKIHVQETEISLVKTIKALAYRGPNGKLQ